MWQHKSCTMFAHISHLWKLSVMPQTLWSNSTYFCFKCFPSESLWLQCIPQKRKKKIVVNFFFLQDLKEKTLHQNLCYMMLPTPNGLYGCCLEKNVSAMHILACSNYCSCMLRCNNMWATQSKQQDLSAKTALLLTLCQHYLAHDCCTAIKE